MVKNEITRKILAVGLSAGFIAVSVGNMSVGNFLKASALTESSYISNYASSICRKAREVRLKTENKEKLEELLCDLRYACGRQNPEDYNRLHVLANLVRNDLKQKEISEKKEQIAISFRNLFEDPHIYKAFKHASSICKKAREVGLNTENKKKLEELLSKLRYIYEHQEEQVAKTVIKLQSEPVANFDNIIERDMSDIRSDYISLDAFANTVKKELQLKEKEIADCKISCDISNYASSICRKAREVRLKTENKEKLEELLCDLRYACGRQNPEDYNRLHVLANLVRNDLKQNEISKKRVELKEKLEYLVHHPAYAVVFLSIKYICKDIQKNKINLDHKTANRIEEAFRKLSKYFYHTEEKINEIVNELQHIPVKDFDEQIEKEVSEMEDLVLSSKSLIHEAGRSTFCIARC